MTMQSRLTRGLGRRGNLSTSVVSVVLAFAAMALLAPGLAHAATPSLTASPSTASPGTGLTISGSGWTAGDSIFVQIGSASFDTDVACVLTADSSGKISGTQAANGCVVPNVPNGSQPLVGIDEQSMSNVSHGTFAVTGGFAVTPGQGQIGSPTSPGTSVSAVAHGFSPNSTISGFKFDGVALATTPSSVTTDANGNATGPVTFTVPATATAGANTLTATDAKGKAGTQSITIFLPTATVTPASGSPGTGLKVTGAGWPAGVSVFVQIGATSFDADVACVLIANSSGKISGTQAANGCAVPNVPNGSQPLVGVDEQSLGVVSHSTFTVNGGLAITPGQGQIGSPSSPGTSVSAVAHGFAPNSTVSGFKFDGKALTTSPASISTDANGNATSPVTFTVPSSAKAGTNTVTATDGKGNVGTQKITIYRATATVTPTSGSPGTGLTVTGSGWPKGASVFVQVGSTSFDADVACVLIATSKGKISGTQAANGCVVPDVPNGSQPLVGVDEQSLGVVSHTTFKITGGFAITPGQGQIGSPSSPGTSVSAVAHGFAPNSTISGFKFDGVALTTTPSTVQTDANGNATSPVTFTVPATATVGSNTLTATDGSGNAGTQAITIYRATATVTPTSGAAGTGLTVTGSGWPAGDSVFIQIGSTSFDADVACVLTANASGAISGTQAANGCVVPNVAKGAQPLVGVDEQSLGVVSHATFTVK
jgi:hypothetical protein